jgi:hypothetical protein
MYAGEAFALGVSNSIILGITERKYSCDEVKLDVLIDIGAYLCSEHRRDCTEYLSNM